VIIAQVSSMVSGAIAMLPKKDAAAALGFTDPQTVHTYVTITFATIAGIAQLWALGARACSKVQPVTLTKVGADLHPNTLAVEQSARDAQR
jgi:hypothetical protein